jgi:hypothetical protein
VVDRGRRHHLACGVRNLPCSEVTMAVRALGAALAICVSYNPVLLLGFGLGVSRIQKPLVTKIGVPTVLSKYHKLLKMRWTLV